VDKLPGAPQPQEIRISVHLTDRIDVNPRIVFFRKNDLQPLREEGTPVEKTIEVKAMFDEPYRFNITSAVCDHPQEFKIQVVPVREGREYRLVVTVDKLPGAPQPPPDQVRRSIKGNITLKTDDAEMQEISIRCICYF